MKTITSLLLTTLIILTSLGVSAQDENKNQDRKTERAERKAEKKQKEEALWASFQTLAKERKFIVELVQVGSNNLSPRTNFIAVSGDTVVVQLETNPYLAENGLGGSTIYGTVSDYKYDPPKGKRGTIQISFNITSDNTFRGNNIQITVGNDGYSQVFFGTNFRGNFKSLNDSEAMLGGSFLN